MAAGNLRVVLVTPETTLLDEPVSSLRFPLYDGQIGILPGRAPLVGRLGCGELLMTSAGGQQQSYFIDGGFAQIKGSVVSILTNRAFPSSQLKPEQAEAELAEARAIVAHSDVEFDLKQQSLDRARQMRAVSQRGRS